ncbi:MAG TPA: aspartate--tRNA(Asn) ligase [Dehalococcoidia bacterium]|nr:aspartate--tRNA(Asn) ligase [Dehalococcoidia bacterium]
MERIFASELPNHAGERVRLQGWLHRLRRLSEVTFLVLRDASGLAQVVVHDSALDARLAELHAESVLAVEGLAVAMPQAPGGVELHEPSVEPIAPAAEPPPFDLFRPAIKALLPTILDHAPLSLRHPAHRARFRLAAAAMEGFRQTLRARRFVEIQTPKLVGSATEGGANVFRLDYFGRPAYLAQSPQFYKQIMVGVFERVFEVGPVFRAEPHDTPRHLNEYVSLDAELGFIADHTSVMAVLGDVLRGMLAAVAAECAVELSLLRVELPSVPETIPAIHFAEAQALLARESGEDPRGEPDLAPAHERWLGEWTRREHGSDFLFVAGYPMVKRPFYTHPDPARPAFSNSFDLLFRGLELVTGGQRLHLYADYLAALARNGLDPADFAGYLEAFKHGMPPHGGFAIGLERFVGRLIGAANIREATLFPRDLSRLAP